MSFRAYKVTKFSYCVFQIWRKHLCFELLQSFGFVVKGFFECTCTFVKLTVEDPSRGLNDRELLYGDIMNWDE